MRVNIIPIAITKAISILDIKRYFGLVIIPKKNTTNSATEPPIHDNATEAITKLLNMVNIFCIGMDIPPLAEINTANPNPYAIASSFPYPSVLIFFISPSHLLLPRFLSIIYYLLLSPHVVFSPLWHCPLKEFLLLVVTSSSTSRPCRPRLTPLLDHRSFAQSQIEPNSI